MNQPVFTQDWFSHNIPNWEKWLYQLKGKSHLRFLEIGSYEGRATRWLLENILTQDSAKIYCIDQFLGSMEHEPKEMPQVKKFFEYNIQPYRNKVLVFVESSQKALRNHPAIFFENFFDFIYIDGSHQACHVLEDAILSFRFLKKDGLIIFDDYEWNSYEDVKLNPKLAIDSWLACFEGQYEIIHKGWQVCLRKTIKTS